MRENPVEVAAGAVVVAAALGFLLYAVQASGYAAPAGGQRLTASFRSVEGISLGSDVRMAGVKIGSVSAIRLDPETFRAQTELTLLGGLAIPEDSSAVVASEGLLGGSFVEIVPGASFEALPDGGEIVDTQGAVSLLNLLLQYVSAGSDG
ncbi:outer membrane lipid asymmetry maintenance protein MlaD [Rubellimicrobium sp. CFH 75288]|uniref:outer membrane lipid asymmetry maintenance protein MlaD n=1 Tax=Rubellimicrobium sp. CFH 75288 TaxID=2697034 RepID=UPI001411DA62|nr:outer membrane lipid asymmetry maintenance protein MlaD [Rubellimicrobium sp. CFH 75288]NAZ37884.1 outer membrane lipid asymmetry maintenance protein MlaD [Rubellimicrobium sp. CFH 75288]